MGFKPKNRSSLFVSRKIKSTLFSTPVNKCSGKIKLDTEYTRLFHLVIVERFMSWFAQKCKHFLFVILNTWLVKRVDPKQVSTYRNGVLEKVDEAPKCLLIDRGERYVLSGYTALLVGRCRSFVSRVIYSLQGCIRDIIESVQI